MRTIARAALVAAALLFLAACSQRAPEEEALDACKGCYDRYQRWINLHGRAPETAEEMAEVIPPGRRDPWGNAYELDDDPAGISVWSRGPDGHPGTEDDISFPPE